VKVNDDGSRDPFGSKAIHGAIAKAIYGETYDIDAPVEITLEQAGWLFHVLSLAMGGNNLETQKTMEDRRMMARWECVALEEVNNMKRIHIINPSPATMANVAGHS
jgi:hypothetical protein